NDRFHKVHLTMSEFPEKSKRKEKPKNRFSSNQRLTLWLVVMFTTVGSMILLLVALYMSNPYKTPCELTSTNIALTNYPLVVLLTVTNITDASLTLTAVATPAQ